MAVRKRGRDVLLPESADQFSANARRVLGARYLRRDVQGEVVESPAELLARVARAVAHAELMLSGARDVARWEESFHVLLSSLDFLPNSPTLMNAGTKLGQLSACFVLPVEDSMEGIFDALKDMALVQRTGGGTGFSFSRLRPRGAPLSSTGGKASGPVSFMKIFDCATEHVKLGGRRRGANMGVLRVDHPDILDFVAAKRDASVLHNFNVSVGVTDVFMRAVEEGGSYALTNPQTGRTSGRLRARRVFESIVDAAWHVGDPGLLFLDQINGANPVPHLGTIEATNPCGEVPLLPFESCNLGSINLAHMLRATHRGEAIDWQRLRRTVELGVRFLDDVVEVSRFPTPEIERATCATRKLGLGVMGFAELLIRLGVSYDSDAAIRIAGEVMRFIVQAARLSSAALARERGVFPAWARSVYAERGAPMRNATVTSIAPTGTISILAGTTASIEPLFATTYVRRHVLGEQTLTETTPLVREYAARHGVATGDLAGWLAGADDSSPLPAAGRAARRLFATALRIPPERHLGIQAAFQRYTDNSVSKTVNLPHDASPADVERIYRTAWTRGLKGVTVYRYGSRATQVLELGAGEEPFHFEHAASCDPTECRF
jgi:ribonucleoside-diphosphate reductase alpha chain